MKTLIQAALPLLAGLPLLAAAHDGGASRRTCVLVDAAGDRFVFETPAGETGPDPDGYGVRRSRLVGGSGKYAGLVGEVLSYPVSTREGAGSSGRMEIRYRSAGARS